MATKIVPLSEVSAAIRESEWRAEDVFAMYGMAIMRCVVSKDIECIWFV